MKAKIKPIKQGKFKGQFRFELYGNNGEPLDPRQPYNTKQALKKTLKNCFPGFEIEEEK